MKNKNLMIGLVAGAILVLAIILIARPLFVKKTAAKITPEQSSAPAAKAPDTAPKEAVKKTFPKGKGGLTLKMINSRNEAAPMRAKLFKSIDARLSHYASTVILNSESEVLAGTYDVEINTTPQKIYKGVTISDGGETVEDVGATGALNVKAWDYKNSPAFFPISISQSGTGIAITTFASNQPLELLPGTYDIDVETRPRQSRKDVRVEPGKETMLDIGCTTGGIFVKVVDESGKEARREARVKKPQAGDIVAISAANRPIEVVAGVYDVEIISKPNQLKKDVKVSVGEEISVEFIIETLSSPLPDKTAGSAAVTPAAKKK